MYRAKVEGERLNPHISRFCPSTQKVTALELCMANTIADQAHGFPENK
jgi:hypothetical protein